MLLHEVLFLTKKSSRQVTLLTVFSFLYYAAGISIEVKNWPPIFPLIHHVIANEIPVHLQRLQYVAFATYLGTFLMISSPSYFFTFSFFSSFCWDIYEVVLSSAGLVLCLFWNIIAITTAWIKGEGLSYLMFPHYCIVNLHGLFVFRSDDMASCPYLLHSGCPRRLCVMVSSPLPCLQNW